VYVSVHARVIHHDLVELQILAVVIGVWLQVTNNPENDGVVNAVLLV